MVMVEPRSPSNIGPVIPRSPENGDNGTVAAAQVTSQQVETGQAKRQPDELHWYIVDEKTSSFTAFIKNLRDILAKYGDSEGICDPRHREQKRPLLAMPRSGQQTETSIKVKPPIQVKLELSTTNADGDRKTSTTTLVIREDNVDVIGFMNQKGEWYELGYQRMLPAALNSVLLGWGNSYKSILDVLTEEEVIDRLTSARLGKKSAMYAVYLLSSFDPAGAKADDIYKLRLYLVGLMFMISESAKMNHVQKGIEDGWDAGKGFTRKLMTDYVWKYVEMSRRLREWKRRNYQDPRPESNLLDAIYLVLNEEIMLSFAYPEVLKISFPEMFKDMFMVPYTVKVNLRRDDDNKMSVKGKIVAFICDEHRHSVPFRAGTMLFSKPTIKKKKAQKKKKNTAAAESEGSVSLETCVVATAEEAAAEPDVIVASDGSLVLQRSVVFVPSGWVLGIDVDLQIKIVGSNNDDKDLKATVIFDKETSSSRSQTPKDSGIKVEVTMTRMEDYNMQDLRRQLSHPVEVFRMISGHPTMVYTIGEDVMSYTEFIMALRRILSDHRDRQDILDSHDFLNLCCTREHPVLAKMRSVRQVARWLNIRLQVVEGEQIMSSTTLVMRCEDLYIHGFFNHEDNVLFSLRENKVGSESLIPKWYHSDTVDLTWDVSYPKLLQVDDQTHDKTKQTADKIVAKLKSWAMNQDSSSAMKDAVKTLSLYTVGGNDTPGKVALAYLLIMVCESARFNPIHNSVVDGWSKGTEFTSQMLQDYIWKYRDLSDDLRKWKSEGYVKLKQEEWKGRPDKLSKEEMEKKSYPISQLKAIYLVHSGPADRDGDKSTDNEKGESSNSSDKKQKDDSTHGGDGQHEASGGGGGVDPTPPSKGPTQQSNVDADEARGHGLRLMELVAVRADLWVIGTKIIVFDAKRGQIIYRKKERQEDQEMVYLDLTGPYRGISAYECFAIEIEIPADAAAGSTSGGEATITSTKSTSKSSQQIAAACDSIIWEWNCYDPGYAAEVDKPPVTRTISSGRGRNVEVTYAVMSNARQATVQVMVRPKDGPSLGGSISGEITAVIENFKDEDKNDKHKSFLFKRAKDEKDQTFPTTKDNSWYLLPLARNVVAVPCSSALDIVVNLLIQSNDGKEKKHHELGDRLSFENGICSSKPISGKEFEVQVELTWYPEIPPPSQEADFSSAAPWDDLEYWADWRQEQIITSKKAGEISTPTDPIGPLEFTMLPSETSSTVTEQSGGLSEVNKEDYLD